MVLEGGRNRCEAQLKRDARIASFKQRVEGIEEDQREVQRGDVISLAQTHCRARKQHTAKGLSQLIAISLNDLEQNKTHKGQVLFCRSAVRCMYLNSLATLIEDVVNLQVYSIPAVRTIWEAQAWLPEGSAIAIVEPFYKIRADGTLGIRVDNPEDVIFNAIGPASPTNACPASSRVPAAVRVSVEERLIELAGEGLGQKRIHKQLRQEGYEISENVVRRMLREHKEKSAAPSHLETPGSTTNSVPQMEQPSVLPEAGTQMAEPSPQKASQEVGQQGWGEWMGEWMGGWMGGEVNEASQKSPPQVAAAAGAANASDPVLTQFQKEAADASNIASSSGSGKDFLRADAQQATTTLMTGVPAVGTRVAVQGLQSEAGKDLNGQEGVVIGQDLMKLRALVELGSAAGKAIKFGNLIVVHASATPLPIPCLARVGPCLSQLVLEERWVEAIVFGQCLDTAFLSHTMPVELLRDARGSGSVPQCLIAVIEAVVEAYRKKQSVNSSAGPDEMDNPSSILPLCKDCVASTSNGSSRMNYVLALVLRGLVQRCMQDWQAAALDYRAAYVTSEGQLPWILLRAGWCMVSSTEGLPLARVQDNDAAAQQMYEIFLHYLSRLDQCASKDGRTMRVFSLWELAFVCQMRASRLHPLLSKVTASYCSKGPPARASEVKAQQLFQKAIDLKDQALVAESSLEKGIMNCLARESVLTNAATFKMITEGQGTQPESNTKSPKTTAKGFADCASPENNAGLMPETQSRLSAHQQMEAEAAERMEKEQEARDSGDIVSMMLSKIEEQAWASRRFEEGMKSRRRDLESQMEALAAREAAFGRRESHMAEQHANLVSEAAQLKGDKEALNHLYLREKQRQEEDFKAELAQLRKQYERETSGIQSLLHEASLQREQEHFALLEGKRRAEKALEEVVGAREAEVDRWQQEIRDKEDQISSEQNSLKLQSEQLAKMQADLAERSRLLGEQDQGLKMERKTQQQFEADGKLSLEMLGAQKSGHRKVRLHDIRFSQDSISPVLSDGRSAEQATEDLKSGKMQITDFPTIKVVELASLTWSLDNRRLLCMQTAFARQRDKMIDVHVESLKNEKIRAEFHRKFTAGRDVVQRKPRGSSNVNKARH